MAQAKKIHYLSQYWPRSMLPYGIIRSQWVEKSDFRTATIKFFLPSWCCSQIILESKLKLPWGDARAQSSGMSAASMHGSVYLLHSYVLFCGMSVELQSHCFHVPCKHNLKLKSLIVIISWVCMWRGALFTHTQQNSVHYIILCITRYHHA